MLQTPFESQVLNIFHHTGCSPDIVLKKLFTALEHKRFDLSVIPVRH